MPTPAAAGAPPFGAVKLLQKRTGAGFADCKAALIGTSGDIGLAASELGETEDQQAAVVDDLQAAPSVSGLTLVRIEGGDGCTFPKYGDQVAMHYRGTLAANGKEFDSSYKRGKPFSFTVGQGQVIRGWDEGALRLSLGEKAELLLGPEYAYGDSGAGTTISPDAALKFEVHLVSIDRPNHIGRPRHEDYTNAARALLGQAP